MLANNFSTSTCFVIFELIKFMCYGSTLIYPHEEFLIPHPQPQQVQPARKAVRVPSPAPEMRVPATRAGL